MNSLHKCLFSPLCMIMLLPLFIVPNVALDTITLNQTITDGETIVSSGGRFELGFFSPGSSKNRYVGIWYKDISVKTPVWVANRETSLTDSSGTLKVMEPGFLVLLKNNNQTVWSSNVSSSVSSPVAQLLDNGNLVVKNAGEENPENFLWQSFDYPGNTLLEGMKIGKNFVTGKEWQLTSWKIEDDPSPGDYTYKIDTHGSPQVTLLKGGNIIFRLGPWIGDRFSGQSQKLKVFFRDEFMFTNLEVNYSLVIPNVSYIQMAVLKPSGVMQRLTWSERQGNWVLYSSGPLSDVCDNYATCGAYGRCYIDKSALCECLDGYVAKASRDYSSGDWSSGCVRRIYLDCGASNEFLKYSGKLPDTRNSWFNTSMTLEECRIRCLQNCSCTAYSSMKFDGEGSGCLLWFDELMDLNSYDNGEDIYIRMASSESAIAPNNTVFPVSFSGNKRDGIIIGLVIGIPILLLCLSLALFVWKKKLQNSATTGDLDLPLFDFAKIVNATDNFSVKNKLGEGGYGAVYKVSTGAMA